MHRPSSPISFQDWVSASFSIQLLLLVLDLKELELHMFEAIKTVFRSQFYYLHLNHKETDQKKRAASGGKLKQRPQKLRSKHIV